MNYEQNYFSYGYQGVPETPGRRRLARLGPELPVCSHSLTSYDCRELPHEGGHKHSHVLWSQCYKPVRIQTSRGRMLGHQPDDGLMPQLWDFCNTEDGPVGVHQEPLHWLGQLCDEGRRDPIAPRRLVVCHGLLP